MAFFKRSTRRNTDKGTPSTEPKLPVPTIEPVDDAHANFIPINSSDSDPQQIPPSVLEKTEQLTLDVPDPTTSNETVLLPDVSSSVAALPTNTRKRKILYASPSQKGNLKLSKLEGTTSFDQDFIFELRDAAPKPRIVKSQGKSKQVLTFTLYDATNGSFEATVWDKRVNQVYCFLMGMKLPCCISISHGKVHPPSNKHVPRTSIKNLQFTIDSQAVIDRSELLPRIMSAKSSAKRNLPCDCSSTCDKSCRVERPSVPLKFADLAQKLSSDGGIRLFRFIRVQIVGTPKIENDALLCNVTDGQYLARYEGRAPDFDVGHGTELELDAFEALFTIHTIDTMMLLLIPHATRPIKASQTMSSTDQPESFEMIQPVST